MSNIAFLSVSAFKAAVGTTSLEVVKNPNTNKLFVMDTTNGGKYKCQQDINNALPMAFIVEDGVLENACLCNVKSTDNVQFAL